MFKSHIQLNMSPFSPLRRSSLWPLLLLAAVLLASSHRASAATFYYSGGKKHALTPSATWVGVAVEAGNPLDVAARELRTASGAAAAAPALTLRADKMVLQKVAPGRAHAAARAAAGGKGLRPLRIYEMPGLKGPMIETGELLVQFKPHITRARAAEILAAHGAEIEEPLGDFAPNGYRAVLPADQSATDVANAIHETGETIFSHPNFICTGKSNSAPNDPLYTDQWHLRNTGQNNGTPGADVRAEQAWNISTGSSSVSIAVMDDGIDTAHEDFSGKVLSGYDYRDSDNDPRPAGASDNHGTACAGIALAVTNNGKGVAGMARGCKLVPVRVYDSSNNTFQINNLAQAFYNLADSGVHVMSCSWTTQNFDIVIAAINYAATQGRGGKGCVIVFSAGNDNVEIGQTNPLSTLENVICVGASDKNDKRASYSNYGASLDVVAPGGGDENDVVTTDRTGAPGYNNTNYAYFGGTSASCPLVAGVAALLISNEPSLTAEQVRDRIKNTATKIDPGQAGYDWTGHSDLYGHGRLNAARALGAGDTTPPTVAISTPTANGNYASLAQATGSTGDVGTGVFEVRIVLARTSDGAWWNWSAAKFDTIGFNFQNHVRPATGKPSWTVALPSLPSGYYQLQAQAVDNAENASAWVSRSFSIGDLSAPVVTVTSPAHNSVIGNWTSIQGSATDTSGILNNRVQFTLYQNGQFWTGSSWSSSMTVLEAVVAGNGSWTYPSIPTGSQLRSGRYYISASAYDNGNTASQPIPGGNQTHFDFDGSPPEIEILKPANGWTINGLTQISGTASDLVGQPSLYIIRLSDGAFWTASGWASGETAILQTSYNAVNHQWSSAGPLPQADSWDPATALYDGYYNIIAFAYDAAGHETRTDSVVLVDRYQPTEAIISSPANSVLTNGLSAVHGTASSVVERVDLFIHRYNDGKWWNGSSWVPSLFTLATRLDRGAGTWANNGSLPDLGSNPATALGSGSYNCFILAYDGDGGDPVRHDVVFSVDRNQSAAVTVETPAHGSVHGSIDTLRGTSSAVTDGVNLYLRRVADNTYWDGTQWTPVQTVLEVHHDRGNGNWESTGALPSPWNSDPEAHLTDGSYQVIASAYDAAGNVARQDADFTIDTTGPEVLSLTYLTNPADVSDESISLTGVLKLKDPSGFKSGWVRLNSPSGDRSLEFFIYENDLHSGTPQDGTYHFYIYLPRYLEPGSWVPRVDLTDTAYNFSSHGLGAAAPMPAASPGTLEILNSSGTDMASPQLVSLEISPSSVDVTSARQRVTVTAVVTDDLAGLSFGSITLNSPSGDNFLTGYLDPTTRVSGTRLSGTYQIQLDVERFTEPGIWTASVYLSDASSRNANYADSPWATPFPASSDSTLVIANANPVDHEDPQLTAFAINPDSVNITTSSQQVVVTFRVTDDIGGLMHGEIELTSPTSMHHLTTTFDSAQRVSGNEVDGTYQILFTVPRQLEPGTWSPRVTITDQAGRQSHYGGFYGESLPHWLEVINDSSIDTAPPTLASVALAPAEVDVTHSSGNVAVTLQVTDGGSGFLSGSVAFLPPGSENSGYVSAEFGAAQRISGTSASGTYQINCTIPHDVAAGQWMLAVRITDAAGNYRTYATGDPYSVPFPGASPDRLQVINTTGSATGYHAWVASHFPVGAPGTVTTGSADPDDDGVPNVLEYAFNLSPNTPSRIGLPIQGMMVDPSTGARHLTLTFLRRTDASDLTYTLQNAGQLQGWTTAAVETIGTPQLQPDGVTEQITVRLAAPVSSSPRQFLRLRVEQQ